MSNGSLYTESERRLLAEVAKERNVPVDVLEELVRLELSFHSKGRRRGLFPALRSAVSEVAERRIAQEKKG